MSSCDTTTHTNISFDLAVSRISRPIDSCVTANGNSNSEWQIKRYEGLHNTFIIHNNNNNNNNNFNNNNNNNNNNYNNNNNNNRK